MIRLYVDTMIVIEAVEQAGSIGGEVVFELAEDVGSSEMTLAEVLVRSIRDGDPDIRSLYEMLFSQETRTIETHPVTLTTLVGAAELRARHPKLKLFDAIHLSTALQSRCSHFIKKDRELLRVVDAEGVQMSGPRSLPADEHDALSLRRALSR